jgi:hypothetical protein
MNMPIENDFDGHAASDGQETLRLIAALPAPAGIEERVKAGLRAAPRQSSSVIRWPHRAPDAARWTSLPSIRAAAAAAIVMMVGGGGWGVYSHIRVAPQPAAVIAPEHLGGTTGLSSAGATRKPRTLDGPVVNVPAEVKTRANVATDSKIHKAKKSERTATAQR